MSTLGAIITIPYLAAALAAGLGMLLLGVALLACLSRANGSDDQEHKSAEELWDIAGLIDDGRRP